MAAQMQRGTLLNEAHLKITTITIKEITPFGIRLEQNEEGEHVGPAFYAQSMSTASAFLKSDGTFDWQAKSVDTTKEGDVVIGTSYGTGRRTAPGTSKAEGEILYMTQSPKLSWLNNKKFRLEGASDPVTGEDHVKIFAP